MSYWLGITASGTDDKPVAGVDAGTVAIWDAGVDGDNWEPVKNPLSNLADVKFHNALAYKKIVGVHASTDPGRSNVTLPNVAETSVLNVKQTLFAHGLGYRPLIVGQISNGSYTQPVAGCVVPLINGVKPALPYSFRCVWLTADDTNVYMVAKGWYSTTVTLSWKVWLFDEEFQVAPDDNLMIQFEADGGTLAALGPIDADHLFIREKVSGSGEMKFLGKQTIEFGVYGPRPSINYSDGTTDGAILGLNNVAYPAGSLSVTGTECEIVGAPVADDPGFYLDPPMRLVGDGGQLIFTTDQPMLAGLKKYSGSITTSSHAPSSPPTGFDTDHFIGDAGSADIVFGWMTVSESGKLLPDDEVTDFSGTVIVDGVAYKGSGALIIYAIVAVSPIISGGNLYIKEHGWSHIWGAGTPTITIPAFTVNYELYAGKMVGGS